MNRIIRLRLVQFDAAWMNPDVNRSRIADFIKSAGESDVDVVVFPELSNLGYITPVRAGGAMEYAEASSEEEFDQMYRERAESIPGPFTATITELTARYELSVVMGMARRDDTNLYNSAVLIDPSGDIYVQDKLHIPLNEKAFFTAGEDLVLPSVKGVTYGLTVCYDSRFPEVSRSQALAGADLVIAVLAGPDLVMDILGTPETLIHRAHVRAQENGIFYAVCNRAGVQGSTRFIGHSGISAPSGEILARGGWEEEIVESDIDLSEVDVHSESLGVMADRRPDLYSRLGIAVK